MRSQSLSAICLALLLLCGCSSTKFTLYHLPQVIQGAGGTMRDVDGIDFWEKGDPDRKYKILGVINEVRRRRVPLGRLGRILPHNNDSDARESAIANAASKHGGDAVIFVRKDQEQSDAGEASEGKHSRVKYVVVKYVE